MAALLEPADAAEATPGRSLSGFLAVTISRGGAKTVAHRLEPRASEGTLQASKAAMPQEAPLQLRKGAGHPTSLASNGDASGFPPTAANKGQPKAEPKLRPKAPRAARRHPSGLLPALATVGRFGEVSLGSFSLRRVPREELWEPGAAATQSASGRGCSRPVLAALPRTSSPKQACSGCSWKV